jgi:homoserine kinase type II
MAVYTDVTPEELSLFLENYALGSLLSVKGIAEGVENSNFMLHLTSGTYILTLFEKRTNKADLPFFLGLMEHLSAKKITCPLPVKNNQGEMLGELCGRPATIITFLEGFSVRKVERNHCFEVGEVLAKFHNGSQDFALKRPNALTLKDWRPLFNKSGEAANSVQAGLHDLISHELDFLEKHYPKNLPTGVLHADLFTDNVFFLNNRLSGIIDFYFACNDFLVYDLAICLNAWCFDTPTSFDYSKGAAMIAGYKQHRALSVEEQDALPILARGSALRFLLTRLYDWLNVPEGAMVRPKDPLEYVNKLRFHQKIKSAKEYGL